MNSEVEKLLNKVEELGWGSTKESDTIYVFNKLSPAGQDFSITINTENDPELFVENIYKTYDDFDVSYEAYLWLDNTGHGINGAPYDMRDVYNDMEACHDMILDLYYELNKILEE